MKKKILLALVIFIVLGGGIFIGIVRYGFSVMNHPTSSMANTIIPGEKIAVTKFYGEIKRGDIVVFKYPVNPEILYLKRVIGLPGETIEARGTKVFINGQELPEKKVKVDLGLGDPNASKPLKELAEEGAGEYKVFYDKQNWETGQGFEQDMKFATKTAFKIPPGKYFMMGDSRDNSMDSRFWGPVSQDAIVGKAYMIFSSDITERAFQQLK